MKPAYDHERLRAYQEALRFVAWVQPVIESLPAKLPARDNLDRASTSVELNIAEGNGKRGFPDRCRFLNIARGSALESAACLDVLAVKGKITADLAAEGKEVLVAIVSLVAGLIARFSGDEVGEDAATYAGVPSGAGEKENE